MSIDAYRTPGTGTGSIAKVIGGALVVASMLGTPTTGYANLTLVSIERTSASPNNAVFQSNSLTIPPHRPQHLAIRQLANLTWMRRPKYLAYPAAVFIYGRMDVTLLVIKSAS